MVIFGISISALLQQAAAHGLTPLDARLLLAHVLQLSRVQLITQGARVVSAADAQRIEALYLQRAQGAPIAYLVGTREFYGLELLVTPAVLIPRADTELLVDLALAQLDQLPAGARVLELGTGSGAIAIALASQRPDAKICAIDCSIAALEVARRNATRHQVEITFLHSDWYQALTTTTPPCVSIFDLIVANPPYIAIDDPHLQEGDLRFEPRGALTDERDGLSALRTIINGASNHMKQGGQLLLEHGHDQALAVRALLAAAGFDAVQSWRDLAGIERVSSGNLARLD